MNKNTKILILLLKDLVEQKGLSYYKIAKDTGITENLIRRYFTLEVVPSLDKFIQIANAVGLLFYFETKDDSLNLKAAIQRASSQVIDNNNENEFFIIQKGSKKGNWIATHKKAKIVVEFEQGKFNETQKVTMLEEFPTSDYSKVPTYMRQLGDWLATHHGDKI